MTCHAESIIRKVMASEAYRKALVILAAEHDRTIEDIVALTEIAAPPFQEAERARAFLAMAKAHGLASPEIDAAGNVTGIRPGVGNGPLICVAAHLDTVFPAGTEAERFMGVPVATVATAPVTVTGIGLVIAGVMLTMIVPWPTLTLV